MPNRIGDDLRQCLAAVRIDILCRGYTIKTYYSKSSDSVYLSCLRKSDGRHVRVRVSDHPDTRKNVDVSIHVGGADREQLLRWLK
jgi:hypothetical protein